MTIFINQQSRVLVQGITGRSGSYYTYHMLEYGTNILGGVTPGKGGEWIHGKPVFDTMKAAVQATGADTSIIYVPAPQAADAIYEAVECRIKLIICITEGIPIQDMIKIYDYVKNSSSRLIGPNSAGILIPGVANLGIIPTALTSPGNVGVVSKSGTLTYSLLHQLTLAGIGQSACVSIGSDPIIGTSFVDVLELFENDPDTDKVVLLGEIGGTAELEAANYIKTSMTKRVVAFVAGVTAPHYKQMGHAGAVIEIEKETAQAKINALRSAGVKIAHDPEQIPDLLLN